MCIICLPFDTCYMILQCYLHSIYISASFTGYEDDIFKVISNLHVQGSKFGGEFEKFGGNFFKKIKLCGFHGVCFFSKFDQRLQTDCLEDSPTACWPGVWTPDVLRNSKWPWVSLGVSPKATKKGLQSNDFYLRCLLYKKKTINQN